MTRQLLALSILLFSVTTLWAQNQKGSNGIVKGTITTSDGKPAAYVTIKIDHTALTGISDEQGAYIITNVKPGSWKVKTFAVSIAAEEKEVTVVANQTTVVDFVLKENATQLEAVVISTKNLNKENRFVGKMPLKNLENPQVYSTVSSEILKQQAITSYDDAMRNVPGISRTWESTGRSGDGGTYFALRGFDAQPTMYNGLPGITSGNLDPANVEEIEVIKGPSGTLFGGSFYSYGGIINTITKKPYFTTGGEFTYNVGSYGLNRVTADINIPFSKSKKIAMRVNAAYHSENSFQDAGFKKSFFISPSFVYQVNDRLSFHVMAEILEQRRAVPPVFFHSDRASELPFKTIKELNLNNDLSFTSDDITIKNPRYNLQAQMLYKLSDQWTSQTVFTKGVVKSNGYYTYIWDDVSGDNEFSQYFKDERQRTNTTDIQQNFNGDFKIAGMRNRVLVGLDFFSRKVIDKGSNWGWARNVTPQGDINYIDPFTGDELPPVYLTKESVGNLVAATGYNNSNVSNYAYSAYVSDVLNITPNLSAMASLRVDYFDSKGEKDDKEDDFDQTALSPKFGLVYQPLLDKVSVFANYMNAFVNVAPLPIADNAGVSKGIKSFKPEHADQWEFGVKTNLFANKLTATVSVYNIKVSDRVTVDPDNHNDYRQGGKVKSKGFELDLKAYPVAGLNIIAGYSYNDIKVKAGNPGDFYAEVGHSPGGQGPAHLANLWANYKFPTGILKNFGIGLGGNYAGEYKVIDNPTTGNFYLPSYTLVNAALSYNAKHFSIACNVNNIGDEVYYIGYWSVNPQRRRNFVASITCKL